MLEGVSEFSMDNIIEPEKPTGLVRRINDKLQSSLESRIRVEQIRPLNFALESAKEKIYK